MILVQSLLGEKFVWVGGWWVGGLEGKFSVSFGPKLGFRLWVLTWTKLNKSININYISYEPLIAIQINLAEFREIGLQQK